MTRIAVLFSFLGLLAVLGCGSARNAGLITVAIVPPPEVIPVEIDSITVTEHIVFWTTMEVRRVQGQIQSDTTSPWQVSFNLHLENHSEGDLADFEVTALTLYQGITRIPLATFELALLSDNSPMIVPLHSLKKLTYDAIPVKVHSQSAPSDGVVYGRLRARWNGAERYVSTAPVRIIEE